MRVHVCSQSFVPTKRHAHSRTDSNGHSRHADGCRHIENESTTFVAERKRIAISLLMQYAVNKIEIVNRWSKLVQLTLGAGCAYFDCHRRAVVYVAMRCDIGDDSGREERASREFSSHVYLFILQLFTLRSRGNRSDTLYIIYACSVRLWFEPCRWTCAL